MEYANHLSEYAPAPSEAQVAEEVARIRAAAKGYETDGVYRLCYSAIDLTTLSCSDSVESVTAFARKAVEFYTNYPAIANVASICIYPPFVETVGSPWTIRRCALRASRADFLRRRPFWK